MLFFLLLGAGWPFFFSPRATLCAGFGVVRVFLLSACPPQAGDAQQKNLVQYQIQGSGLFKVQGFGFGFWFQDSRFLGFHSRFQGFRVYNSGIGVCCPTHCESTPTCPVIPHQRERCRAMGAQTIKEKEKEKEKKAVKKKKREKKRKKKMKKKKKERRNVKESCSAKTNADKKCKGKCKHTCRDKCRDKEKHWKHGKTGKRKKEKRKRKTCKEKVRGGGSAPDWASDLKPKV